MVASIEGKTIIVKVSEACNIECDYCYIGDLNKADFQMKRIPDQVLNILLERVVAEAERSVKLIWHGGEPLLVGKEFYRRLSIKLDSIENNSGLKIENAIQTNGILLDQEMLDILANRFSISISFDGPQNIHDLQRHTFSGKGTYLQVVNAIDLLKSNRRKFGTITVLTAHHLGRESVLYDEYKNLGLDRIKFNHFFVTGHGRSAEEELLMTPDQLATFYINFYNLWANDPQGGQLIISPLDDMARFAAGMKPRVCVYGGCKDTLLEIDPVGDVYPCGKFAGERRFALGSILDTSLSELTRRKEELYKDALEPGSHPYICPFDSHEETGSFGSVPRLSAAHMKVVDHLRKDLEQRVRRREELAPNVIITS